MVTTILSYLYRDSSASRRSRSASVPATLRTNISSSIRFSSWVYEGKIILKQNIFRNLININYDRPLLNSVQFVTFLPAQSARGEVAVTHREVFELDRALNWRLPCWIPTDSVCSSTVPRFVCIASFVFLSSLRFPWRRYQDHQNIKHNRLFGMSLFNVPDAKTQFVSSMFSYRSLEQEVV